MYNQEFVDQQLPCADCGQEFTFNAEDQAFYHQKGYTNPKRCPICRANRKGENANKGNTSRRGFGNKPQFQVICSACGRQTTVPFEPAGDRPVYCSDCYRNSY